MTERNDMWQACAKLGHLIESGDLFKLDGWDYRDRDTLVAVGFGLCDCDLFSQVEHVAKHHYQVEQYNAALEALHRAQELQDAARYVAKQAEEQLERISPE